MMMIMTGDSDIPFGGDNDNSRGQIYEPLNAKLTPICHLLALLAHHILHVSRIRGNNCSDGINHDDSDTLIIHFSCHLSPFYRPDSGGTVGRLAFLHGTL
jgi:hypothetical protein